MLAKLLFSLYFFFQCFFSVYFCKAEFMFESQWIALGWICIPEITSECLSSDSLSIEGLFLSEMVASKIDLFWLFSSLILNNV